ncbi:MAG: hypothetical protein FJ164_11355, partial [Gammaproteobacteria bacterium]|nr:hypothetical protein [Gammaproteobacteria bacterium]
MSYLCTTRRNSGATACPSPMAEEILVNVTPQEARVAFVENGVLQELLIERSRRRGFVGNLYLGRVNR